MIFSDYIRKAGISQQQAADELGTSQQNISRWCQGGARPRDDMMRKVEIWSDGKISILDWYQTNPDRKEVA